MRAALQRWFWLAMLSPAGAVFAAEPEHGLRQSAVRIEIADLAFEFGKHSIGAAASCAFFMCQAPAA